MLLRSPRSQCESNRSNNFSVSSKIGSFAFVPRDSVHPDQTELWQSEAGWTETCGRKEQNISSRFLSFFIWCVRCVCVGWGETRRTRTDNAILGVGFNRWIRIGMPVQFHEEDDI